MCGRTAKIAFWGSLVAAAVAVGCGQEAASDSERQGSVIGEVTLEGADDHSGVEVDAAGESTTTEPDGSYELHWLDPGDTEVVADHPDYQSATETVEVEPGEVVTVDFELQPANRPPVIETVDVESEVILPGETTRVVVEARDPDGGELDYQFEATGGFEVEPTEEPAVVEVVAPGQFGASGEVLVTVEDEAGETDEAAVSVETAGQEDPIIDSITAVPDELEPGGTASLEVDAHAPHGGELSYRWDAPEGWGLESDDLPAVEVTAPEQPEQTAVIEVVVQDEFGAEADDSVVLSTTDNSPPEITELTVDPPQVAPGESMELSVEAEDPDGGELSYQWSAPSEWTIQDESAAETTMVAPDEYGVVAGVDIEVTDEYGAAATGEVVVSTIEATGPQITEVSADPSQIDRGGLAQLEVVASHPEGAELDYEWIAPQDWQIVGGEASASPQLEAPDVPGETATVEVTVTDPQGLEAVASVVVSTFENQPPVIESIGADPAAVVPGETTTISAEAEDPDGESLTYHWDIPAGWDGSSDTGELQLVAPDEYDQSATVGLVVDDGWDTTSASVSVSTVSNVDPTISSFDADPAVVEREGTSELSVDAQDPFGEPLDYEWSIDNNDWSIAASGATATLTAPDISADTVEATVTVTDGVGGSATASLTVETEENFPPTISSFDADPIIVEREGTSELSVDAQDPNGEPLDYDWSVDNGDWQLDASGDSATLVAPDIPENSAGVEVQVDDGYGGEASAQLTVTTVPNEPPVISSLQVDPDDWIEPEGTAELSVQASTGDGDPISYDWSVPSGWTIVGDGDEVQLEAPDESDVSATVTVTVSDAWGDSDSDTVEVRTQDVEPAEFEFDDQQDVVRDTTVTSDTVQIEQFDGPVAASCSGCEVSVNGGDFDDEADEVYPGDDVQIRVVSSADFDSSVTAELTVGQTTSATWMVTTTGVVVDHLEATELDWGDYFWLRRLEVTADGIELVENAAIEGDGSNVWASRETTEDDTLDIREELTVSAWITVDYDSRQYIVSKNIDTGFSDQQYLMGTNGGNLEVVVAESEHDYTDNPFPDGWGETFDTWRHVAFTWDGEEITTWGDAEVLNTHSHSEEPDFKPNFSIGRRSNSSDGSDSRFQFDGNIDDVRIYDRALDPEEIEALYRGEQVDESLAGHWPMDENGGDDIADVTGNDNDVQLNEQGWIGGGYADLWMDGEGERMSQPISLEGAEDVIETEISWKADEPSGTEVVVEVAVSGDDDAPPEVDAFDEATSGDSVPGIEAGDDVSDEVLWVRQRLQTDGSATPTLEKLSVEVAGQ